MQILKRSTDSKWTVLSLIQWAASFFKSHHIDSPRLTAEILLAYVLGADRINLYMDFDRPLNSDELSLFKSLVKRRLKREPVAYIVGKKEFFGIELAVSKDVLIPRPETEFLVEEALRLIPEEGFSFPWRIIDLGTGSGAIIVAIAKNRPGHHYFAEDISLAALAVACANAKNNNVNDIRFFAGEWFSSLSASECRFDLIISNPPYIPTAEIPRLEPEITDYEPTSALDGGPDGMMAIRHLIETAPAYLKQGGKMLLEIGHDQKDRVEQAVVNSPYFELEKFIKDYGGHHRVAVLRKVSK